MFAALGTALMAPPAASAHGLVGRTDLPIPEWLFAWAASIVLVVSFIALAALWPRPRLERAGERPLVRVPAVLEVVAGAIGVAVFALVVYSGLAGTRSPTANLAPTFVYVVFWVGLVVASAVLGDVFHALNPWRALARVAAWTAARIAPGRLPAPLPYPERLGRWPAAAGIAAFAWLELAYSSGDDPALLAWLALAYAALQLVGMSLYGIERWTERADAFAVYFNLFSRLSPFVVRERTLRVRPPLAGVTTLSLLPGTVALLCVMIGSTTFDGASSSALWSDLAPRLQEAFTRVGASEEAALELAFTLGLGGSIALIALVYRLGVAGMRSVGGAGSRDLAGRFAHTLVPIALAYALAHYFSLLVYQGQAALFLASDPLGDGANLLGTADIAIDYGVISATGIWYVQVGALVVGHVAGLVLAHDRALVTWRVVGTAVRSQYWMLAVMVGYTSLGLWLLSAVSAQ